jgi:peptide/nickel transport system substrate-binding protein
MKLFVSSLLSMILTQSALAAEPVHGGTLVFGRGGDSVGLDPANESDGESFNVTDHVFDNLVRFKPGQTDIEPALATEWKISKDGLSYTFKLRPNVKFHDGSDFNADAVVFSFERQRDPKHPAYGFGGPYVYFTALQLDTLLKEVKTVDPLTVEFKLKRKYAPFISCLAMQSFAIVSPTAVNKFQKDFRFNPVGTGAFVFKKWERNQKIVLEANKNYWDGRAYLDSLVFRSIPDNNTRMIEMMAGNLQVMDTPNPDDIPVITKRMGDKVVMARKQGFNIAYLALNNEKKPFDNPKVRQAIAHAVDKNGIISAIYGGNGEAAVNPMPPTLWGYNDQLKSPEYNIEKAKALLAEAGLAKGFETTLYAMPVPRPYMPDGRKVAEAIQGDLAKIGVKAKIVSYEWGTYLEKTRMGEHEMALLGWTGDIGDPDNFLYVLLDKDNAVKPAQNISFYKNDAVHNWLIQAQTESDVKKRSDLYRKAQAQILQDVPLVPLAHSIDVVPLQSKVQGFVIDPTGRRRFAKVWLGK